MKSVLITGCNRGIGLGLVKQFVKSEPPLNHIIATCRNIDKAENLTNIAKENSNVHIVQTDINKFDKHQEFTNEVEKILGGTGLNLLINNAGISSKFTRINLVKVEQMIDNLVTNTVAPLMLTKALLPLIKKASDENKSLPVSVNRAAVVNISSILGSIQENKDGGFYPYRTSKAALNAVTKSMSVDFKNDKILVVSVHPGWCKTDMGGKGAPLEVEAAVSEMLKTLSKLGEKDSGTFIQYDGKPLPW